MRKIIQRKSDSLNVGVVQLEYPESIENPFEWEIENNVIPNHGGNIEDYKIIDEKTWLDALKETPEYKKQAIENELRQLDTQFLDARLIEDLITGKQPHKSKLDIITQKQALRTQLQGLGV
jgi:hypothetical protein